MNLRSGRRARLVILTLAAAGALAGCGKTGALDRPGPLFGENRGKRPVDQTQQQDPNRPITTIDPRDDRATQMAPPRSAPIPGTSPDPFGAAPQGALPDPYAKPDQ